MTLSELIKTFRAEHDMSYDEFAQKCGFSKSYVYALEKNEHPKTKEPIEPSLSIISRISNGTGISVAEICKSLDLSFPGLNYVDYSLSSTEKQIIEAYRKADELDQRMVLRVLGIFQKGKAKDVG